MLAEELGLADDELRQYLREEIQRRRVASAGDSPDVTPVAHQHET